MRTVRVQASGSYDICIERGILAHAAEHLSSVCAGARIMIVSDDTVWPLYGVGLEGDLIAAGWNVCHHIFPHGEQSKTIENYVNLLGVLAASRLTRNDTVLALGGGVIGDLAGFAAATYLRGVRFVQVPTTLLSMVDSSVGGKTAVDLPAGKNLAGAFYQPVLVLCDPDCLRTLPAAEFSAGCAEVIKYAMLGNADFFHDLEQTSVQHQVDHVIEVCVTMKRDIVAADEFDRGMRRLLNYGHTFGHAVELCSGYSIPHGQAVSIGMAMVTRAAVLRGICPADACSKLLALLHAHELPTECMFSAQELMQAAEHDKKATGRSVSLIVPVCIGRCEVRDVPMAELSAWIQDGGAR